MTQPMYRLCGVSTKVDRANSFFYKQLEQIEKKPTCVLSFFWGEEEQQTLRV